MRNFVSPEPQSFAQKALARAAGLPWTEVGQVVDARPDIVLSHVLQSACGRYGTTRDYVEQTVNALRSHAMPDKNLEARLKRCSKGCSDD